MILSSWPFALWGLDMVGPLKTAPGGFTHILVAIDKFTKWIEAKPIATLKSAQAVDFMQSIVVRFGVPNRIITDLGSQFISAEFKDWAVDLGIRVCYASVAHLRSNGRVE
jgi:transposase InsO family protein